MLLKDIITDAYSIFNYPVPTKITNVCTECCVSEEEAKKLLTIPLKKIDVELMQQYNDGAQALNYDMNEFKYFLPRYLELISQFNFTSSIDDTLSLKNLNFKNTAFWHKKEEVDCINSFAKEFSNLCFCSDNLIYHINFIDIIIMFQTAEIDIKPILDDFIKNLNSNGLFLISEMMLNDINYKKSKIINAFATSELSAIVLKWLNENKNVIMDYIEDYIMNYDDETRAQKISDAYTYLKYF